MTIHTPRFDPEAAPAAAGTLPEPAMSPHPEDRGLTPRTPLRAPGGAVRAAEMNGRAYIGRWIAVYQDWRSAPAFTALVDHVEHRGDFVHVHTVLPVSAARDGEEGHCWIVHGNHLVTSLNAEDLVPLATWELHWFVPEEEEALGADLEHRTSPCTGARLWNGLAVIR